MKEVAEKLEELASNYSQVADHLESRLATLGAEGKLEKLPSVVPVNVKRDIKIYRHRSECLTTTALLLAYYFIAAENERDPLIFDDIDDDSSQARPLIRPSDTWKKLGW